MSFGVWQAPEYIISNRVYRAYVYSDLNCQEQSVPAPVIVPISVDFLNAADFVELLGQSAFCTPNTIPRLPL